MKYRFKVKPIIISLIVLLTLVLIISSFFKKRYNNDYIDSFSTLYQHLETSMYPEEIYSNRIVEWSNNHISDVENFNMSIFVDDVIISPDSTAKLIEVDHFDYGEIVNAYSENKAIMLEEDSTISFKVSSITNGLYSLGFDFYDIDEGILANEISITINGQYPYYESRVIMLRSNWQFTSDEFVKDRYHNEIQSSSDKERKWVNYIVSDSKKFHLGDMKYNLKPNDEITIQCISGSFLLGNIYLSTPSKIASYQAYLSKHQVDKVNDYLEIAAEDINFRNDPSIRLRSERDPSATNYHTQYLMLNVIDGSSWRNGGQGISWVVDAPKSGLYQLSFKYLQNTLKNLPQFREIKINGEIPYQELACYAFPYTRNWINRTLSDNNGNPYLVYLNKGENEIEITSVSYPYRNLIENVRDIMNEISSFSLEIKKITGNSDDAYRDWDIDLYLPNSKEKLLLWAERLDEIHASLSGLSNEKNPAELTNLISASKTLRGLARNVNNLPSRLIKLSDGDSSVAQMLGDLVQRIMVTNLEFEKIMFHGDEKIPKPESNIFLKTFEGLKRLVLSFTNNPYKAKKAKTGELVVWVNHPRQYIEIMQNLIDASYDGPMQVTLSQMPDENKLILANATNRAPDVAIGVNHWIPHEFAIRGAAVDLRQFAGYEDLVSKFSKGVMIPYAFEDGMYGLPETQNFWLTFYRRDILNNIGINEIPETWDQIIDILPQLQRYGMNYFSPVSMFEGFKPFVATLPFIYQFGGDLYANDGMQTAINSAQTLKGMELMTELFTLYDMPQRVPSFYNHFRYGTIPIGISDLSTYLLLTTASSELQGLWDIALHPGVKRMNEQGEMEIFRYATAGGQSSMILKSSKYQEAAWDFLSWWMSTDVQVQFAFNLQTTYGQIYFWNTANLEAFMKLPLPKRHKDLIIKQWEYAIEASRIPGAYMVEREISNTWNKIVFDGVNARLALDEAVRVSNREIMYKMEEFGYVKNGVKVKDYKVPSIYTIDQWLTEVRKND